MSTSIWVTVGTVSEKFDVRTPVHERCIYEATAQRCNELGLTGYMSICRGAQWPARLKYNPGDSGWSVDVDKYCR